MGNTTEKGSPIRQREAFGEARGVAAGHHRDPKGKPEQVSFDPDQRVFSLKRVLPAGMTFPYDFGFLPRPLERMGTRWTSCC